jgi:hypothetical protein
VLIHHLCETVYRTHTIQLLPIIFLYIYRLFGIYKNDHTLVIPVLYFFLQSHLIFSSTSAIHITGLYAASSPNPTCSNKLIKISSCWFFSNLYYSTAMVGIIEVILGNMQCVEPIDLFLKRFKFSSDEFNFIAAD